MTDFLYTDARWTEHFVEVNNPHKEGHHVRFYFEPPKRTWVGLTDEEAQETFARHNCTISADLAGILARAIGAKLKKKNT
jgi:hypothetical protein